MNLAAYAIQKRTSLWVIIVLILLGGYLSYNNLGRFEDPEFTIRKAVINTSYEGASAQDVADEVTDAIEAAVQSMQEVKEVTSVSKQGRSEVDVEIKLAFSKTKAELEQVWDKLRRKVNDAQRSLPSGAGPSFVNDDFADVYALFYGITAPGYSNKQLHEYAEFLSKELALVGGVAKTALIGQREDRIYIEISSERLENLGVTAQQVYQVLQKQNTITVAGDVKAGSMRLPVIPESAVGSFEQLKNLPLGIGSDGQTVKLKNVADVKRGYQEPAQFLMEYNGERAIGLGISNVSGGNVVEMGNAVKARLAELDAQRPVGMELNPVSIQSDSVQASISDFVGNLAAAVVIVFVVLLAFIGLRSGVIIGFVLLLTVAGTLIIMLIDDIAMQRVSLGALIIALGMLVDNAIVVTDAVLVKLRNGEDRYQSVVDVVQSTRWPLLGGTLVGILAFSAIGLSPSDMGEYAGSLFWVILYSMALSWLFSVTVIPILCYQFLTVKQTDEPVKEGRILRAYRQLLQWVLKYRKTTGVVLLALFAGGIAGTGLVPPGFMPESQRPQFVVDVYLPQGTDISHTADVLGSIADDVTTHDGVTDVTSFIGGGGLRFMLTYSPEPRNASYGQLLVDVEDESLISPLISKLQSELTEAHPEAAIKAWKFMLGRGGDKKIEAGFSGPDSAVLRQLAEQAKALMEQNPNLIAVQDDWRQQVPVVVPTYNHSLLQKLGLTSVELNQAVAQTLNGRSVGQYREADDLIPLVVRAPFDERSRQRAIESINVYSEKLGESVPVSQLTDSVRVVWQDAMIRRVDRQPTIMVQSDPAPGIATDQAFTSIREQIEAIERPPGYELTWYGEYKASRDANEGLAISAPYGFAAMILVVVFMFNAIRQPLVIWCTVPFAVVGVVIGLASFQAAFEFMAILGFLSLIGMMVKNAIVLVDQADNDIQAGIEPFDAVVHASISRARPVVLGALTTIMGVAPLLMDPFFKSMAVTIMFGLLFATALTLVVIPLLYSVFFRIQSKS
ncbi:efflux RND transporter permease subunit [uncultured Marinobacter sp.]|uniref:efflux RND transporter permease subunit n=1 Tax=uncultured Marinobacter sp. TaxID=187379 RepID=UPI002607B762|nr:efflux RND transporter permease subunit [uncultured Marinobacter sp.]